MRLIVCLHCDLLQHAPTPPPGGRVRCRRCGIELFRTKVDTIDRTLALVVAGLVLYAVAHAFPFLSFHMQGRVTETHLATGIRDLWDGGMGTLAGLVLVTTVLAPLVQLLTLLYVLLPIRLGRSARGSAMVFGWLRRLNPWSMMEVFMLGVLVSFVKLADMAEIVPGLALWSFALLIVVLAAAASALDPRAVWERVEWTR